MPDTKAPTPARSRWRIWPAVLTILLVPYFMRQHPGDPVASFLAAMLLAGIITALVALVRGRFPPAHKTEGK
jgi:hypothetical protein